MNGDELFALPIVLVIAAAVVVARRQAGGGRIAEAGQLRDEMRDLRERLQVLERVVTETHSTADLDRRIERLRD